MEDDISNIAEKYLLQILMLQFMYLLQQLSILIFLHNIFQPQQV
jgi:hypothetical protein